jgi:hypothetical protein
LVRRSLTMSGLVDDAPGEGISSGQLQLIGQFQLAGLQRRIDHATKAIALRKVGTALDVSVKTGVRYAMVEAQHAWHVKRKLMVDAAKPRDERGASHPVVMLSLQDILKDAEQLDNAAAAASAPADPAGSPSRGSSIVAAGAGAGAGAGANPGASQPKKEPDVTEEARDAARRANLHKPRVMRSPHQPYIPHSTRAAQEGPFRATSPRHANDRHAARLAGVAERAVASLNKYESISMYRYANRIAFDPVRCSLEASGSRSGYDHSRPLSAATNATTSSGEEGGINSSMHGKPWFPELRRNMRSLLKLTAARIVIHFPIAAFDERWFMERTANIVSLAFWHTHVRFFAEREWQRSTMLAAKVKRLALAGASADAAAGGASAATSGSGEAVGLTLEEEEAAHMASTLSPSRDTLEALRVIGDCLGVAYVALMKTTLSEHLAEATYEDDPPVATGDRAGVRTPPKTAGTVSSRASVLRGSEVKAVSPAPVPVGAAKHTTKMEARVTGRANARKSRAFLDVLPWAVADAVYHAYYFLLAGNRGGYGASFRLQIFLAVGQLLSSVELAPITVMNAIGRHFPRDPLALLHQEFSAGEEAQAGLTVAHAVELANGGKSEHLAKALPARTPADIASLLGGPNFDSNMRVSSSDGGNSPTKEIDAEKEEEEEALDRVLSDSRVAHLATTLGYRTPFALFQSTSKADRALLGLGEASRVEVSRKLHRSVALPVSAYLMAGASIAPPLLHASASIAALLRVPPTGHPSLLAHVTERLDAGSSLHSQAAGRMVHVHNLGALSSAPTLEDPQLHKFLVHSYQWAALAMAGVEESADEVTEARRKMILENAAREIAERNARRDAAALQTSALHAFGGSIHDVGPKWLKPWEKAHVDHVSPEGARAALAKAKQALEAAVIARTLAPSPSRPVSAASAASTTRGRAQRKASVVDSTETKAKHEMIRKASSRLLMSQWEQGQSPFARSLQLSLARKRAAAALVAAVDSGGPPHAAADEGDEWGLNEDDEDEEVEEEEDGYDQEEEERWEEEGWETAASPVQPSPARSRLAQALAHADSSRNVSGAGQALGGSSIYSVHLRPAQSIEDSHYLDYEGVVDDEGEFGDFEGVVAEDSGVSHAHLPVLHSSGGLAGFVVDTDGLVSVTSVMPRGNLGASDADLAARMLTVRAKHSPLLVPFVMTTASRMLTSVVPEAKVGMRPVRAVRRSMPVSWASAGGIDTTRALYKAEKAETVMQANHATTLRIAAEARAARELSHRTEMEARTNAARLREKVLAGGPQTIAREAWRVRTERARAVAVKMAEAERQRDDYKAYGRSSGGAGSARGAEAEAAGGSRGVVNPADPGHSGAMAIPGDATITHPLPGVAKGSLPPIALSLVQLGAVAASTQGISGRHAFEVDMVALKAATDEDKATRKAHAVLAARTAAVEEAKLDEVRRQRGTGLVRA